MQHPGDATADQPADDAGYPKQQHEEKAEKARAWPASRAGVTAKPIAIERNVWIAAGAMIIGGVTVGENSVVAAGSVVTRDVPPNTLVGGNPARVIRSIAE